MNRETKRKFFAGLVLVLFIGSTLAFAISFAPSLLGEEEKPAEQPKVYEYPLSAAQESTFLQQNFVIVKYFYNSTCPNCNFVSQSLDKIFNDLGQKIIIEKIETTSYPDEVESAGVTNVPYFYLKGRNVQKFEYKSSNDLFISICDAYIQPIDECAFG